MPLLLCSKDKPFWKALKIEDVKVMQMDQFWLKAEGINKSTPSSGICHIHPIICHENSDWKQRYSCTLSLNPVLRGGGWLTPRSGRLKPGNDQAYYNSKLTFEKANFLDEGSHILTVNKLERKIYGIHVLWVEKKE